MGDARDDHRHTVLVVDDDASVRDLFIDVIAESGHAVAQAADGAAAVELLDDGLQPCLVLSDLRMPRMDGWELSRELRRRRPELPVVVVTGDKMLSFTSPAGDKPVDPGELESLIRRSCRAA